MHDSKNRTYPFDSIPATHHGFTPTVATAFAIISAVRTTALDCANGIHSLRDDSFRRTRDGRSVFAADTDVLVRAMRFRNSKVDGASDVGNSEQSHGVAPDYDILSGSLPGNRSLHA